MNAHVATGYAYKSIAVTERQYRRCAETPAIKRSDNIGNSHKRLINKMMLYKLGSKHSMTTRWPPAFSTGCGVYSVSVRFFSMCYRHSIKPALKIQAVLTFA